MTLSNLKPKNLGIWLLGLIMIMIPTQYYANPIFGPAASRVSQQQILQVVSLAMFAIFVLNNVSLSLFLLWTLFLYTYLEFPVPVGVMVLTILSGIIIYEVTYRIVNKENINRLFTFMLWIGAINLLYMAMQAWGWELLFSEQSAKGIYQNQLLGFMNLKAIMGILFAMIMPFMVFRFHKLALLLFVPLYVSECSVAMVAGIASYLWQIWHVSRKWFLILISFMVIGGGMYAIHDSHAGMYTDRLNMWKVVLRDCVKRPIIGWGPDSFRCVTPYKQFMYMKNVRTAETSQIDVRDLMEFKNTGNLHKKYSNFIQDGDTLDPWDNPHNEYIMLFYEFGIIGVLILLYLIYDMKRRFTAMNPYLIPLSGFFIGLAIICTGQFPLHLARVGIYIPIFLACYYKLTETETPWKS